MSEATSAKNELSEVDYLYRRLAALDSRRPGEWVRRKVQAYSAQQAAERALRESAEGRGKPVTTATAAPTPKATSAAPAARALPAEKKTAGKPFLLILICATVAVVALVGFLVVPGLMAPRGTPPVPPPPPVVAQVAAPNSYHAAAAASISTEPPVPGATSESPQPSDSMAGDSTESESPASAPTAGPAPSASTLAAAPTPSAPVQSASTEAPTPSAQTEAPTRALKRRSAPLHATRVSSRPPVLPTPVSSVTTPTPAPAPMPAVTQTPTPTNTSIPTPGPGSASAPAVSTSIPPEGFWRAAQNGDAGELQGELAGNVDVNALDPKGRRALILAIDHGHVDIVRTLLAHGANPNLPDAHGATPRSAAHTRGNFEILAILQRGGMR
jgi:Ankyrin repeats (many copies)